MYMKFLRQVNFAILSYVKNKCRENNMARIFRWNVMQIIKKKNKFFTTECIKKGLQV